MLLFKRSAAIFVGASFIYFGSLLAFPLPGTDIPQTAQTIAVLVTGAVLGFPSGGMAVALYVLGGTLGLPIFSDGGSGIDHLLGSSGGYFLGFVLAACFLGYRKKSTSNKTIVSIFLAMLLAHVIILLCGWLWMTTLLGPADAWSNGVRPFYYGSVAKSIIASLLLHGITSIKKTRKI